jgi:TolB-like protein/tetratricopeptide (TPR) repeat protein
LSLFNELKRRNVFRVGIAYLISAWLLAQIAKLLLDTFNSPDWTMQFIVVVLAIGLPLALFFAWAFELTPTGIKKAKEVDPSQSITHQTSRKLDFIIIGVLVVALGYFTYDKLVLSPARDAALIEATTQAMSEQAAIKGASAEPGKSIAVLPFVNMSEDTGNEYFADGLSEELLNLLVKIPNLRVAARTSSFSFKGKDLQISEIAETLNVNHVLEGSVRKSGNKVRITAQLIKADDGFHLWSENFDRTLDDIFTVQDEIASKVAQALEVTLMGTEPSNGVIDPDAYVLFLKGLHFLNQRVNQRDGGDLKTSAEFLLQAIELEPGYAGAWSVLALNYHYQTVNSFKTREDGVPLVHNAIERARSLDPGSGVILGTYAYIKKNLYGDWSTAQAAVNKAYELDPNSKITTRWRASTANSLGKFDEAIKLYERAILNDPLSMAVHSALGLVYTKVHRYDEAIETFNKQAELNPKHHWTYFNLGKAYLLKGDAEQALLEIKKNPENVSRIAGLVMAYSSLGRETEAETELQRLVFDHGEKNPVSVAEAYSWRGQKDKAFEWLEKAYVQRDSTLAYMLGNNVFYSLKDDPRWADFLKKMNLLEFWLDMPAEYGGPTRP